jgi:hypothetical protein
VCRNGRRRQDSLPERAGWTIREIEDSDVILQNGLTVTTIPLTDPELKPLDDTLN